MHSCFSYSMCSTKNVQICKLHVLSQIKMCNVHKEKRENNLVISSYLSEHISTCFSSSFSLTSYLTVHALSLIESSLDLVFRITNNISISTTDPRIALWSWVKSSFGAWFIMKLFFSLAYFEEKKSNWILIMKHLTYYIFMTSLWWFTFPCWVFRVFSSTSSNRKYLGFGRYEIF